MSLFDMQNQVNAELLDESVFDHPLARDCLMGMGQTSENVAEKYGIGRLEQDKFAVESHRKAANA
jgi:acetyl-CoA acyltransferase 1